MQKSNKALEMLKSWKQVATVDLCFKGVGNVEKVEKTLKLLNLDLQFRANLSNVLRRRTESSLPEVSRGSRQSPGSGIWPAARDPPSSRRGLG